MISFHNPFCQVIIKFLTVKAQNTLMKHFSAEPAESFQRLKQSLRKLNEGLNSASYSGPLLWNKLSLEIKRSWIRNSFKHNVKNHYLRKMKHTGYCLLNLCGWICLPFNCFLCRYFYQTIQFLKPFTLIFILITYILLVNRIIYK